MENNVNYEYLVKKIVNNINLFLKEPIVILEEINNNLSIEFKNKNIIIKELNCNTNKSWERFYFNIFSTLIQK